MWLVTMWPLIFLHGTLAGIGVATEHGCLYEHAALPYPDVMSGHAVLFHAGV